MKLQLKAVAKMSISWIIIVVTSYSRDNLPIGLQYITIQLVCNKREYKYYVCIYNSHLTSNDTGPDVKASEQQDTMKNLGHRKKIEWAAKCHLSGETVSNHRIWCK